MSSHRPTLLLLHSAATLSGVWAPLRREWAQNWHILAPDLLPDRPPGIQLKHWADAAAAQITAVGTGSAHVVGASLGASVALRLALDYPLLVASLCLDSAQLGGPPPPAVLRRTGQVVSPIVTRLPTRLVAAALLTQFSACTGEERATVYADMVRLGMRGIMGHLRTQLAHDIRADVWRITAPTLLLAGEHDPLTRSGAHEALRVALPAARLCVVAGAGHVTFLSHPEAIMRELPAWIRP